MQIARDEAAKRKNFVRSFKQVRNHYRHHSGSESRSNAVGRIFQCQTQPRLDPEASGSYEKRIRGRLAGSVVAVPDNRAKPPAELVRSQVLLYPMMGLRRGDGTRKLQIVQCVEQFPHARFHVKAVYG